MDSGATCHICNSKELFEDFHPLQVPQQVTIGDCGDCCKLEAVVGPLKLKLLEGEFKIGRLSDVIYVPKLAYNLLSIPRITELGKAVVFDELQGHILDDQGELFLRQEVYTTKCMMYNAFSYTPWCIYYYHMTIIVLSLIKVTLIK